MGIDPEREEGRWKGEGRKEEEKWVWERKKEEGRRVGRVKEGETPESTAQILGSRAGSCS